MKKYIKPLLNITIIMLEDIILVSQSEDVKDIFDYDEDFDNIIN